MSADGSSVNYKDMGSSPEFKEYIRTCNQLTTVHLEQLTQAEVNLTGHPTCMGLITKKNSRQKKLKFGIRARLFKDYKNSV